jgi:hypothetical protein
MNILPNANDSNISTLNYLIRGVYVTQLIGVAARIRLPDLLRDGPRSSEEIARIRDVHPGALHRVMRGLALYDILHETQDGRFELTSLGELLRSDHPDSLWDYAIIMNEIEAPASAQLWHTVKTGETALDCVFGHGYFDHLNAKPELGEHFDRIMIQLTSQIAASALQAYDFSGMRRLVDVGGGQGHFLAAVLETHPQLEGVLFDMPNLLERAAPYLQARGVLDRCKLVGGSFFDSVPPGGDAYLLSWILHDWDDASCIRILQNCRSAIGDQGKLLVVEYIIPEKTAEVPEQPKSAAEIVAGLLDIEMLVLLTGRERTLAEYRQLLSAGGFEISRVTNLAMTSAGSRTILEAVAHG